VAKKLVRTLLLLAALSLLPGCFSTTQKAHQVLYGELKKAVAEADEIQVFSVKSDPKVGLVLSLKRSYRKGEPGFETLTEGFLKAGKAGVVARAIPDRKIVLLSKGRKIYEFDYCTADRRMAKDVNGKYGVLFLSQKASKLLL
jgi:hypothetical protein